VIEQAQYPYIPGETVILTMKDQIRMWAYTAFVTEFEKVTTKLSIKA
jgi:hypothetical protein